MMLTTVARLSGPRNIVFEEEELPKVGENDILIRMEAVGLCHSELPAYLGNGGTGMSPYGYRCFVKEAAYPAGLGHEAVAEVVEVGKNVKRFKTGDKVAGRLRGCMRTYAVIQNADIPVASAMLFKIPDSSKNYKNCLSEPLECTVNIVKAASCQFGERVAVVGCGFMGLLAIAGMRHSGAKQLTAVDVVDEKLRLGMEFGATDCLNSWAENVEELAYQQTEGNFYDVVIEITGSIRGLDTAMCLVRPSHKNSIHTNPYLGHSKVILPSVYSREEVFPSRLGINMMLRTPIMHVVHPMYGIDPCENHVEGIKAFMDDRLPIERTITHHVSFPDVKAGYEWLVKAPEGYIKGVVDF